ncbi:MAG: sugar phosphate isomerase/epimerase [Ruminococcaceae bacterium]|nr:sugar phosphate isomerase/epimerase [Oscillospiraceae bacterium]
MYNQKLALATICSLGIPSAEQIKLFKAAGFEGFAIDDSGRNEDVAKLVSIGKQENMFVEYLHAPFNKSDDMWSEGELGDIALHELLDYTELCARYEIPAMVVHTFIGFDEPYIPTSLGIERYGVLAKRAGELGIKLALENTEGFEYLDALMNALKSEKSAGFCWDSGHELCYNYGKNLTELYGDRLICTHLNDNLGIRDFTGKITYIDDLHLLPFDGIHDWNEVAQRLVKCGFNGNLTFELTTQSKPNRHENDKYGAMPIETYIAEAYNRACRVASLYLKAKENLK